MKFKLTQKFGPVAEEFFSPSKATFCSSNNFDLIRVEDIWTMAAAELL
jgi:hypothetical protein